jgi:hypothetical protein
MEMSVWKSWFEELAAHAGDIDSQVAIARATKAATRQGWKYNPEGWVGFWSFAYWTLEILIEQPRWD